MADDPRRDRTHELLRRHHPGDDDKSGHVERCLALLARPDGPFSRRSYSPGDLAASAFVVGRHDPPPWRASWIPSEGEPETNEAD